MGLTTFAHNIKITDMRHNVIRVFAYIVSGAALFMTALTGCGSGTAEAPRADINRIDSLVNALADASPDDSIPAGMLRPLTDYLYAMGLSTGDIRTDVANLGNSAAYDIFYKEVVKRFDSLDSLEVVLGVVDMSLASGFPAVGSHTYNAVIIPFRQSIVVGDADVFIGLNHYLGQGHPAYTGFSDTDKATRTSAHIPYHVAEALIATAYPYSESAESTLLSRMLYSGAVAKGVLSTVPESSEAELLGWSEEEYEIMIKSEKAIWEKLASDNLLFSTDYSVTGSWMSAEPNLAGTQLPGNIGRYMGLRIVESYLRNNPEAKLQDLVTPTFYNDEKALIKANYSPDN